MSGGMLIQFVLTQNCEMQNVDRNVVASSQSSVISISYFLDSRYVFKLIFDHRKCVTVYANKLLYNIGKRMLETYDCFEG